MIAMKRINEKTFETVTGGYLYQPDVKDGYTEVIDVWGDVRATFRTYLDAVDFAKRHDLPAVSIDWDGIWELRHRNRIPGY